MYLAFLDLTLQPRGSQQFIDTITELQIMYKKHISNPQLISLIYTNISLSCMAQFAEDFLPIIKKNS